MCGDTQINIFDSCPQSETRQNQLNKTTHHKELTEGDMGEDVVGFVFATGDPALLPEVG